MLPKANLFRSFWRLGNRIQFNGCRGVTCSKFLYCTITEANKNKGSFNLVEYPALKSSAEDEDFVPPSLSSWIASQLQGVSDKSLMSENAESDVDKVRGVLKNQFKAPEDVVQALNGCRVDLTENLVAEILKRFSNNWLLAFGFFTWAKEQKNVRHSPHLYDLMVDILGKARKFDLMWQLVEEMHNLGGYVTLVTMIKVIRRLAKGGRSNDAISAFRRLEHFEVSKDIRALNLLLDALLKEGRINLAESVFEEFKDMSPNIHTFNPFVHYWCKTRQLERAMQTIAEMKSHDVCPDVFTYTCLVEAYCREKDFSKVDATLDEMCRNGCQANLVTHTIIMKAYGKAQKIDKALEIYEKLKQDGYDLDSYFYCSLIEILSTAGRIEESREIFDNMSKQGVAPNLWTYNKMIAIETKHSEENALKLLQKMEETQCKPDMGTYVLLLKMCCRLRRMKILSFLLNHMKQNDVSIDLDMYSLLVRALSGSGKLDDACSFFEEAVMRGFVPMDSTFKHLVQQLEEKGRGKQKERIEELMLQAKGQGSSNSS